MPFAKVYFVLCKASMVNDLVCGVISLMAHFVGYVLAVLTGCTNGDSQLVNGPHIYQGRVEVCYNGVWGDVCDDFWGTPDTRVLCKQLGFSQFSK